METHFIDMRPRGRRFVSDFVRLGKNSTHTELVYDTLTSLEYRKAHWMGNMGHVTLF